MLASAGLCRDAQFARGLTLMGVTRAVAGPPFRDAMARGESWNAAARKFAISREGWKEWEPLLA